MPCYFYSAVCWCMFIPGAVCFSADLHFFGDCWQPCLSSLLFKYGRFFITPNHRTSTTEKQEYEPLADNNYSWATLRRLWVNAYFYYCVFIYFIIISLFFLTCFDVCLLCSHFKWLSLFYLNKKSITLTLSLRFFSEFCITGLKFEIWFIRSFFSVSTGWWNLSRRVSGKQH